MSDACQQLCNLQAADPQKFGYLRNNWRAAKEGRSIPIEPTPGAADIYANIANPSLTTRALGYTLLVPAELDVLQEASGLNAGPLYDRRPYDPHKLATIGRTVTNE